MANTDENIKWLYDELTNGGFQVGTEDEFKSSLANEEDRQWYYNKARGLGWDMGSYDQFNSVYKPTPILRDSSREDDAPTQMVMNEPIHNAESTMHNESNSDLSGISETNRNEAGEQEAEAQQSTRQRALLRDELRGYSREDDAPTQRMYEVNNRDLSRINENNSDLARGNKVKSEGELNEAALASQEQVLKEINMPMAKVLDAVWAKAEQEDKKADEEYAESLKSKGKRVWDIIKDNIRPIGADGMNLQTSSEYQHDLDRHVKRKETYDLEKMADEVYVKLPADYRKQMENIYADYFNEHPDELNGKSINQAVSDALKAEVFNAVYQRAVEARLPKNKTDFFLRKLADQPLASQEWWLDKIASQKANSWGMNIADMEAMAQYGKEHRALDIMGTVANMAIDPTTYLSGSVGSAVAKRAMTQVGKQIAKGASKDIAARVGGQVLAGRIVGGIAGGATYFATFEALKNAQEQVATGGYNPETGEAEGFSGGDVLKAAGHGLIMGGATGVLSPIIGNVADKIVLSASSTTGKVLARGAELATSTLAEGTIFSIPEWLEGNRDAFDVWTDNMAMMIGFKASHAVKSAPSVISGLRPVKPNGGRSLSREERIHNNQSFNERLKNQLDGNQSKVRFTQEELEELSTKGYGGLSDLFSRHEDAISPERGVATKRSMDGALDFQRIDSETLSEFDGYAAMEMLMQDRRVSQATRAKAYYILTGRYLPMSTVAGYTTTKDDNGNIIVNSVSRDGEVITSRNFKSDKEAQNEVDKIYRQIELNTIDVGEQYRQAVASEDAFDSVVRDMGTGQDPKVFREIYESVKRGDESVTDSQRELVEVLDELIAERIKSGEIKTAETIRRQIENETGLKIDKVLKKQPGQRTAEEKAVVDRYARELYPEQKASTSEQEVADAAYEGGRALYGKFESGDQEAQAEFENVGQRMAKAAENCNDVFGAEADYWMYRLDEDPWGVVVDPEVEQLQKEAALEYINAKSEMEGVMDAADEATERKKDDAREAVVRRTHKTRGVIVPVTMKVGDKPVFIVTGDVEMFPDGSAVDIRKSSDSVIILDENGEYKFTSPDQILRVEAEIDPEVELANAINGIEAEKDNIFSPQSEGSELSESSEESQPIVGRSLSQEEAEDLISRMESNADVAPQIELTPENWVEQFGEDGVVETPIGTVKMGENQYFKLVQQGRNSKLGMVKPTLINPDVVVEDYRPAENKESERDTSLVFVKAFTNENSQRYYYFTSVTVSKDGREVVTSNQERSINRISKLLQQGKIAWIKDGSLYPKSQVEKSVPLNNSSDPTMSDNQTALLGIDSPTNLSPSSDMRLTETPNEPEGSDLVPTSDNVISDDKGSENVGDMQEGDVKSSALSRVPVDGKTGDPMLTDDSVDAETGWDAAVEFFGSQEDALSYIQSEVKKAQQIIAEAEKAVDKIKPTEGMTKYKQDLAVARGRVDIAKANHAKWQAIEDVYKQRKAEESARRVAEREARDAQAQAEAQARFEEEQRIKAEKEAEQELIGANAVNPKIRERWNSSNKVDGNSDIITLPDGSTIRGRYVMVEAGAASPSHDVNNAYEPTEGFPVDENGQSVNDRDYKSDKDAQRIVEQMANSYDSRALQTPVIVSNDGVVLSGNNRTMSGELAARQGTDGAYIDYLKEFGNKYGFGREQVEGRKHPRVVFVPDEVMPYNATTFARFNAQEMKSQSKPEMAVKLGKVVPDDIFGIIVNDLSRYDRLSDFYADEKASSNALGLLMQAGVINDKQLPEMRTGTSLSANGRELIENTLIGKVFQNNPDAVRQIISIPTLRQSILMGLNEIANNRMLTETGYDLSDELAKAVDLVAQAKSAMPDIYTDGMPVSPFGRMQGLFDDEFGDSSVTDGTVLLLADILNSNKPSDLRKVLATYNNEAAEAAGGQIDMFSGEVKTKEELLTEIIEHFKNATSKEQQALIDAAIEKRKQRAEQEQRGGSPQVDQTKIAEKRDSENQTSAVEPTEAQKEAGNYKKEHRRVDGYNITIENVKGSIRRGKDADGKEWESEMHNDYGYIRGTEGVDGDHIDVFLSDNPEDGDVFVVDQVNADGSFDEHKIMYGFSSEEAAREAYLSNYEDGWTGLGAITHVSKEEFKKWIQSSKRKTKPFSEYKSVKANSEALGKEGENPDLSRGSENKQDLSRERVEDKYDRSIPANTEAQRSAISRIIEFAKNVKNRVERAVIGGITERQAKDFKEKGIDVDKTWVHSFESSAVAHNQKHHGSEKTEAGRGQIVISDKDYSRIPDILESYDKVSKSPNKTKGTDNEVIIYEKEFGDGYVYYLEEKRDNRKSLAFHTMYKKRKGADSSDGFAVETTAPITPIAPSDNLSSNSDDKITTSPSEKQEGGEKSLEPSYEALPGNDQYTASKIVDKNGDIYYRVAPVRGSGVTLDELKIKANIHNGWYAPDGMGGAMFKTREDMEGFLSDKERDIKKLNARHLAQLKEEHERIVAEGEAKRIEEIRTWSIEKLRSEIGAYEQAHPGETNRLLEVARNELARREEGEKSGKTKAVPSIENGEDLFDYAQRVVDSQKTTQNSESTIHNEDNSNLSRISEGNPDSTSGVKKSSPGSQKLIDDFGEKILGARKDMLGSLAKDVENATVQSLIELPFAKAFKRPNLKKMVDAGVIGEDEALLGEAIMQALIVNKKKPILTKRSSSKAEVRAWAEEVHKGIQLLGEVLSGDESHREAALEAHKARLKEEVEKANAHIKRLREWNPDRTINDVTELPDPLDVMVRVLKGLNYKVGDKLELPLNSVIPDRSCQSFEVGSAGKQRALFFKRFHATIDDAVNTIILAGKIARGDMDTELPEHQFRVVGNGLPKQVPTGRYEVAYFANNRATAIKFKEFDNEAKAREFAEQYDGRVRPVMKSTGEYDSYSIYISNPITGEKHAIGTPFNTREEASMWMEENREELNTRGMEAIVKEMGIKKQPARHFYVSSSWDRKAGKAVYFVIENDKNNPYPIIKDFNSREDADKWFKENIDRLEAERKAKREAERKIVYFENATGVRQGKDWRKGKDATPEMFTEAFGFRGVQFGNWTNDADRQAALNESYDALMDMAEALGMTPKAMSLDGELGLAFGARGSGNASAHYEPVQVVINLTKTQGAGALAHEWWHAVDNFLSRRGGVAMGYISHDNAIEKLQPSVGASLLDLMNMLRSSEYSKRSEQKGEYWGRGTEQMARLFESYIAYKIRENKAHSPFLASVPSVQAQRLYQDLNYFRYKGHEKMVAEREGRQPNIMSAEEYYQNPESLRGFPYPTVEEIKEFRPELDNFFKALSDRESETGSIAMERGVNYRRRPLVNTGKSLFDWADGDMHTQEVLDFSGDSVNEDIVAADDTNRAIDDYANEYFGYLKESESIENEIEELPEDDVYRAELQERLEFEEAQIIDARDRMIESLKEFYLRNNTPEDAERIARDMANRVQADVEIRRKGNLLLRDILDSEPSGMNNAESKMHNESNSDLSGVNGNNRDEARNEPREGKVKTAGGVISYQSMGHLPNGDAGEFSYVERQFSRSGEFNFTGNGRIKDSNDVAYLFRALEDYSIENVFAVFQKGDKIKIVHIGMGGPTMSFANMGALRSGYDAFGADKIYLVHNHPSGNLNPSSQDQGLLRTMESAFSEAGIETEGIILDTTSGRYTVFNSTSNGEQFDRPMTGGETEVEVYRFDRAKRKGDGGTGRKIGASGDISAFLSERRLGKGDKVSYLVLSNTQEIIGNFHTDYKTLQDNGLAEEIASVATKFGGTRVVVYGNVGLKDVTKLNEEVSRYSLGSIKMLDALNIQNGVSESAYDNGYMREPEVEYGETRFRDGEKLRAIRELEPIEVESNNYSKQELREIYNNLPTVEKDGREIEFYHSAFKKIYKEGGLFGQIVPVLDEVLEQSVLAYSEKDNLGGMVRPDGTVHKEHPNVDAFDNYVGKVLLGSREYYVRTTVQRSENSSTGTHSFMVTEVSIYEKTANGLSLPITTRARGTNDGRQSERELTVPNLSSGESSMPIVDAKLQQFFERASSEALELDKRDRVVELSEKLNTPIRIVDSQEDIDNLPSARHKRAKGWWSNGEIVVVLPNNADVADIENTIVHEVVGHKGLRALIGEERFNEFLDEVYNHASSQIRAAIDKKVDEMLSNSTEGESKRDEFKREAIEEYMSDMAGRIGDKGFEKMSMDELTLWGKIKAKVQQFLDRFLKGLKIAKGIVLTDKELAYILYKSWQNMRNPGGGMFVEAKDAVMRRKTGWGAVGDRRQKEAEATEQINNKFNAELQQQIDGTLPEGHIYQLGKPGEILRAAGVPDLPIQLNASRLDFKATSARHNFDIKEVKDMVRELQSPVAVFAYGDSKKAQNIIMEINHNGKNFVVGLSLRPTVKGRVLEINSVRTVYPKDNHEWLKWISDGKLLYVDKEKIQPILTQQRMNLADVEKIGLDLDSVTKVVNNFENPKLNEEEIIRFRDGGMSLEETITKMKAEAMQSNMDNLQARNDAMRAIGGNLSHLRQAMARQKEYDITTVRSVTDLAKILMDSGLMDDISRFETKRILSAVNNVVGKQKVNQYIQKVMDIMVDNQLRNGSKSFGRLLSVKGSKVDARGIEVQGTLDPDGQHIAQVVKKTMSMSLKDIDAKIVDAIDQMGSADKAIAENASLDYAGLQIAKRYVEEITDSKTEEKELRDSINELKAERTAETKRLQQRLEDARAQNAAGQISNAELATIEHDVQEAIADGWRSYREYVESTEEAIRQNKIERVESYQSLINQIGDIMLDSVNKAKDWREAEKQRVEEIQHNANSDMEGRPADEHHKENRIQSLMNSSPARFILAPLGTFDQMLRMFGSKNVRGEGYLWNRYMRGWTEATEKEYLGYKEAVKALDEKAKEVFKDSKDFKVKKWSDLFAVDRKLPKGMVRFMDGGDMKQFELTQGNLLYLYMVDKMSDGRMKLRSMGITEDDIKYVTEVLDPRFKELADWMQEEYLVNKRNEYNEVYKRMFGASMAAIENYFPLKILANARIENIDVADDTADSTMPGTSTGSIIKRRRNRLALDVTGANAFSVILDHIQQMEHWAAFAEFNRDLNTLLSYKRFRNQVMNMSSVYGGGKKLWNSFRDVSALAAGAYRPPVAPLDKAAVNVAKGVTAAKVSFRMFTALKQFLSAPAYLSDSNPLYLAESIANPFKAWKWSMENLPLVDKRWSSRMAGDPRLMKTEMDWKMWRSKVVEMASMVGMSPNAFVDALTVSMGAYAMYKTKLSKYKSLGYPQDIAEKRAKQDATILYNQTQQSSESAFLSTMQVDRSWLSVMFTVFRNSSMAYTRQLYDALRNLKRYATPGNSKLSIEFMTKQLERDGIDADKARKGAKREYRKNIIRDVARVAVFGFILQFAWNLGAYLPYLLLGDDEEEKKKMMNDALKHAYFGSVEGLTGGDIMSAAGQIWSTGEGNAEYLVKEMPLASDVTSILKKFSTDEVSAMNDIINLMVQSGVGVNPQSLTDAVVAIMDFCGDDAKTSRECALLIARILNCPQSQIDKLYFDEIEATGTEASKMTPAEIAERYARFKVMRGAPLASWAYGDEAREEILEKHRKRAEKLSKEHLNRKTDEITGKELKALLTEYEETKARIKEIEKLRDENEDEYYKEFDAMCLTPKFDRYLIIKRYKREVDNLTKEWLKAMDTDRQIEVVEAIKNVKRRMINELNDIKQ